MRYKNNELMHYGVPGMKWGVRRWQKGIVGSSPKLRTFGRVIDERPNTNSKHQTLQKKVKAYIDKKIASNNATLKTMIANDPKCAKRGYNWMADDLRYSNKKLSEIDTSRTSLKEVKRIYKNG